MSLVDFITNATAKEFLDEIKIAEDVLNKRKEFVKTAIGEANERKNSLLDELGSVYSRSRSHASCPRSHASSTSSIAVRAKLKAEAAAALKKVQMHQKRIQFEYESALRLEREERKLNEERLAFERKKREEQAQMQTLVLNEEAAVAQARADAIDEELGFKEQDIDEYNVHEIPSIEPTQRVLDFLNSQSEKPIIVETQDTPPSHIRTHSPERQAYTAPTQGTQDPELMQAYASPVNQGVDPGRNTVESCIRFMARREVIANRIEKFEDRPENYHTWKAAFKNMLSGINITPSEELSLMVEYTSNEAKKLVQRLRNAYIERPSEGVKIAWKKMGERFGSSAVLTQAHLNKLNAVSVIGRRDNKKIQELADLLMELQCAKHDGSLTGLAVLDEPTYIKPIVGKLPEDIQNRWQRHAYRYKVQRRVDYPPFDEFAEFIQEVSDERNDPYLALEEKSSCHMTRNNTRQAKLPTTKPSVTVRRTDVSAESSGGQVNKAVTEDPSKWCLIHKSLHPLNKCRAFKAKPYSESLLKEHRICFRCAASNTHLSKDCQATVKCDECQSEKHTTALHSEPPSKKADEEPRDEEQLDVKNKCTEVCGITGGKSCSKICRANVYLEGQPDRKLKVYVVLDDQSNYSLAKSSLFEQLGLRGETRPYTLKTCSGVTQTQGRRAHGLVIESLNGQAKQRLPIITECNEIPDSREEIPTSELARHHSHLEQIAEEIPEVDPSADILILIGRDVPSLLKVHESRNGPRDAPWAQKLELGWVVLGNACLDGAHVPGGISTYRTQILHNGRPSFLEPCPNRLHIAAAPSSRDSSRGTFIEGRFEDGLGTNVFASTKDDNKVGLSREDRKFLDIMDQGMTKSESGNWEAPLPFRGDMKDIPNNRENALKRLKSTSRTLVKKPKMKEDYFKFMQKVFDNGHAEPIPPEDIKSSKPCWYLPHFGIYHPQKPNKIRVVFDSAAEDGSTSLNKLLLSGPDLTNSLLGVLLRFRQNPVAFVADIEQMFHSFIVQEDHRNFLRFFWYRNNDPNGEVTQYRMKVHIFGNTSSPAVATYGLRKTADVGEQQFGSDAKELVYKNFYVDDALKSASSTEEAADLLRRTQAMLATCNLRLHKIASSHPEVAQSFPPEDQAMELRNLDLSKDAVPVQRSLGVYWDLKNDTFTFQVSQEIKPFTRRGVLSTSNSLYDPLGLVAPVLIKGKMLLREMTADLSRGHPDNWDEPFPKERQTAWEVWRQSLTHLKEIKVPRAFSTKPAKEASRREIHTFGDASKEAIGAVSYLKLVQPDGQIEVSFLLGKAKLAPSRTTTIPRLELCAAVLAVELAELITSELDLKVDSAVYYSDSRVVLGYISNQSKRFYVYVSNRVERIRVSTTPDQWRYVPTDLNPADLATRSIEAEHLQDTIWHSGPKFLYSQDPFADTQPCSLVATSVTDDPEAYPEVKTLSTQVQSSLGTARFAKFSDWSRLVKAIAALITVIRRFRKQDSSGPLARDDGPTTGTGVLDQAKIVIIKSVQHETYREEIKCLKNSKALPKASPLIKLSPVKDEDGLLRVGGRLDRADLTNNERHPIILPSSHHVATLLVRHFHAKVFHQGRHLTLGSVRGSGLWILGVKRLINSIIQRCVTCKKLRGRQQIQKLADLPADRLTPAPPFSYVGLDVFGPWQVTARRTRGGLAQGKRWAVLFTCLNSRAIHIEVIESLDTSCFINSLRRFLALRGPVKQLRSDCGTNFVGARNELEACLNEMDQKAIQDHLTKGNCEWVFNPPHASHAGGVWERMIGVTRRILESVIYIGLPLGHAQMS